MWMLIAVVAIAAGQGSGVSVNFVADTVVVPVTLNGVGPYPFLLDLGAPGVIVDSEVAKFLKLPRVPGVRATRESTSGKKIGGTAAELATLEAGGAVGRNLTCTVMDLRTFKRRIGSPVAGIVSGREFGGYVRLDFGAGAIDFSKPASGLAASDPGVVPFELTEAGMPVVSATLDGRHVQPAGIDTMASATVSAPEPMLRQLELVTDSTRRLEVDLPPTGEAHPGGAQVRLKSVRVGGGEIREPICALGGEGGMARLGMGFLRRFRVTLDYETKLLRLEPLGSGEPMREGPLVGYGIGLWRFDGSHWSVWVARGSSAARGGLVSGGILTAVDGKDLKGMGYDGARALLEPHEGTKVSVSVLQGDETHTVELVAEELL